MYRHLAAASLAVVLFATASLAQDHAASGWVLEIQKVDASTFRLTTEEEVAIDMEDPWQKVIFSEEGGAVLLVKAKSLHIFSSRRFGAYRGHDHDEVTIFVPKGTLVVMKKPPKAVEPPPADPFEKK